jgi:hypothetical protein
MICSASSSASACDQRITDQLPTSVADHALSVGEATRDEVVDAIGLTAQQWHQASSFNRGGNRNPGQIAKRRKEVVEIDERGRPPVLGESRPGDDERTANAVLVLVLFAQETVTAERQMASRREPDSVGRFFIVDHQARWLNPRVLRSGNH